MLAILATAAYDGDVLAKPLFPKKASAATNGVLSAQPPVIEKKHIS